MPGMNRCDKCGHILSVCPLTGRESCSSDACWPEEYRKIQEGLEREVARIEAKIAETEEALRRLRAVPIEAYEWM